MKRLFKLFLVMLLALGTVSFPTVSFCQDAPAKVEPAKDEPTPAQPAQGEPTEKEALYAYGVVTEVAEDSITVEEVSYDAATGEEVTKKEIYTIAPDAELENITAIKDVKPQDEVDIEYVEKDGKKVASYVYRYVAENIEE